MLLFELTTIKSGGDEGELSPLCILAFANKFVTCFPHLFKVDGEVRL